MYYEIYRDRNLIYRGKEIIGGLRFSNELMYIPSTTITLPIMLREFCDGHNEVKIFVNDKCFWGIIQRTVENKEDETITVYLDHIIYEWKYRQISVNNAIKDKNFNIVFKGAKTKSAGGMSVSASDFTIFLEEIGAFTTAQYVLRAGASAWTADGNPLPVTVEASAIESKEGEYDVTFFGGEASVTVKATVEENPEEVERDDYTLTASNFSLMSEEVGKLSADDYIARANASIDPPLPLEVDYSNVKSVDGDYSVEFSAKYIDEEDEEQEISIRVTCVVAGDNNGDPSVADNIADIYTDMNFAYPGWRINYEHGAEDYTIDYVYSRQDKLEALTKTVELTDDLWWRVRFVNERVVDVSPFGDHKDYIISKKPSGPKNIRMISEMKIRNDYEHVVNVATVYSDKSDSGMSSLTLREIYERPEMQEEGFPVVILRANVNNERDYRMYATQYPKLAPNNELEYAVIDEESVALEGGTVIEGTRAFNDISPFTPEIDDETQEITDEDRILAADTVYHATIKWLKLLRRSYELSLTTEEFPADIAPGDAVRLMYDNRMLILEDCSVYQKMVLQYNDWWIVEKISYRIDDTGAETNDITLCKEIRIDRDMRE